MSKKLTQKEFIEKSNLIHNNKYDYSETIYTHSKNKLFIICPLHGKFEQIPMGHIKGQGCKKCGVLKKKVNTTYTTKEFIEKANAVHNFKYDYSKSEYKLSVKPIFIICKQHGEFLQKPVTHLGGHGCPKCGLKIAKEKKLLSTEFFIKRAKVIHKDKYNYDFVKYIGADEKVKILCYNHGIFEQVSITHLSGHGCPKCNYENNTFKKEDWITKSKGRIGTFYIIRCFDEKESFYKLGITFNSIKLRYCNKKSMPYNYEIVQEVKSKSLEYIWDLEVYFKNFINNNTLNYLPKIHFKGHKYECFNC